jgi:hypothetical protein
MSIRERTDASAPATSLEVCSRLVEALKLALVGPGAGHALAEERLHRRERPSNWNLTGFLIPSGTPPEQSDGRRETAPDILKLRELHAAMDRAVLDAYGWSDVPTACEFLLDYEIDEEEWGNKKKPWRYRGPTRSATRCWRVSWSSTPSARRRRSAPALRRRRRGGVRAGRGGRQRRRRRGTCSHDQVGEIGDSHRTCGSVEGHAH